MEAIVFLGTYMAGSSREGMKAAKEMGYYTILFTPRKYYRRVRKKFPEVDELIYLEDMSLDNLYKQCKDIQDKGIKIRQSISYIDPHVSNAAKLSEQLGLAQVSSEALAKMENKACVRDALKGYSVSPFYKIYTGLETVDDCLQECRGYFPLVMKYPVSNGSKNVNFVDCEEEFRKRIVAMWDKRNEPILIEEYIPGSQYIIETLVFNGKITIVGVIEQEINDDFIVTGYSYPAVLGSEDQEKLEGCVHSIIRQLELYNGTCHLEMRLHNGEWKLIEINPRMSGSAMNDILKAGAKIDLARETLKLYLGKEPDIEIKSKKHVFAQFITVSRRGRLLKVTGEE